MCSVVHPFITGSAGMQLDIARNRFVKANMGSSAGGAIYVQVYSRAGLYHKIYDNYFAETGFARENLEDGASIYTETGSRYTHAFRNISENQHLAYQDNSGGTTIWEYNLAKNCDCFIGNTDGAGAGTGVAIIQNNTALLTVATYNSTTRGEGSPCYLSNAVAATYKNNLFYCLNDLGATLPFLKVSNAPASVTETNNGIYGYRTDVYVDVSTDVPLTNPIITNIDIKTNGELLSTSDLIGAGEFLGYKQDLKGNASWNPPSIGAIEYERPRISRT
jgi:hypothetical protein